MRWEVLPWYPNKKSLYMKKLYWKKLNLTLFYQSRRAPERSSGFSRIKKIPYQAQSTQLGPQKCTIWENAFKGPKY